MQEKSYWPNYNSRIGYESISDEWASASECTDIKTRRNHCKSNNIEEQVDYENNAFTLNGPNKSFDDIYSPMIFESTLNDSFRNSFIGIGIQTTAMNPSFLMQLDVDNSNKKYSAGNTLKSLRSSYTDNQSTLSFDSSDTLKGYLKIREYTQFEIIEELNDNYPCLELRKALLRIKCGVSQFCYHIVSNPAFDAIILCFIIANAIVLSIEDPNASSQPQNLSIMDQIFLYVYTVEFALKVLAYGFILKKTAYIRDPWNVLDFTILVTAWAANYANSGVNLSALRSLRILRPLKSISSLKGLRVLVLALLGSIMPLSNIFVILFFVLLIFGIIGNQLFSGMFTYQCMNLESGAMQFPLSSMTSCGNMDCDQGYECVNTLNNPEYGMINFDNVMMGFLQCFTSISQESWSDIMRIEEKAFNQPMAIIFSILLIFIGTFLVLSLMEVILFSNFSKEMEKARLKQKSKDVVEDEESADSSILENIIGEDNAINKEGNPSKMDKSDSDPENSLIQGNRDEKLDVPRLDRNKRSGDQIIILNSKKLKMSGIFQQAKPKIMDYAFDFQDMNSIDNNINNKDVKDPNDSLPSPKFAFDHHNYTTSQPLSSEKRNFKYPNKFSADSFEDDLLNPGKPAELTLSMMNSHSVSDEPKDSMTRKGTLLSRMTSFFQNTPKRTASRIATIKTLSPSLTKAKNIKIRKDLAQKLKVDSTKIKACIEESNEISSDSIYDVLNGEINQIENISSKKYIFAYRGGKSVLSDLESLTQKWDNHVLDILDRYSKIGDKPDVFNFLCTKFRPKLAFYMTSIEVPLIIKKIKENDKITNHVIGDWSGYDINTNDGIKANEYKEKMDNMKYRVWDHGALGTWEKISYPLKVVAKSKWFGYVMILCVIANTIVLSINHYGIDSSSESTLTTLNSVFTMIFVVEMGLKLLGLGFNNYCREKMNIFDGVITILGLIEYLFLADSGTSFKALWAIRILRIFRVIRVVRLFRYLQTMTHIINKLTKNIANFFYLMIFVLLFLLIFTIIGLQLFAGKLDFAESKYKYNFDDFYFSFLSIFQIMTAESWNYIQYVCMRSTYGYAGVLFPAWWLVLGNEILLNIFLALVLDMFSNEDEDDDTWTGTDSNSISSKSERRSSIFSMTARIRKKKEKRLKMLEDLSDSDSGSEENVSLEDLKTNSTKKEAKTLYQGIECERSFLIFSKDNFIRKAAYKLTSSQKFEGIILVVIMASTMKLIWDTYLLDYSEDDTRVVISYYLDIAFTILFGIEGAIKSLSMGLLISKGSYLRDSWCQLDFIIVTLSIIDLALVNVNVPVIKVLRLLRILRPLRIISHNIQMKIMINALIESLIGVFNVAIVILLVWLIFAILGVSLFGGKLYKCSNTNIDNIDDCQALGYEWVNSNFNFDSVPDAMIASFILTTQENWPDYMFLTISGYKDGHAPIQGYFPSAAVYFIIHLTISSIFFINLLAGVIFEKFTEAKKNESSLASLILSKEQMVWVELQTLISQSKPQIEKSSKPENEFQLFFYTMQAHWSFEAFVSTCIILNFIVMCLYYEQASETWTSVLENLNSAFTYVFIGEGIIKITGMGMTYFGDRWNRFDFFVVVSSVIDLIMTYLLSSGSSVLSRAPQVIRTIRVLRVTRIIRLVKRFGTLQELITLVSYSIPSILNVSSVLLLIYIIYAILGVFLYHSIDNGVMFDEYSNMHNFDKALVKLFRHSTGENWPDAMFDCANSSAGETVSYIYWCTFIAATTFIMLNVFVMVILQDYQDFANDAKSGVIIFNKDVKKFKTAWALYSKSSEGIRIHYKFITELMFALGDDLGVPLGTPHENVIKLLSIMDIHIDSEGYIYYNDMLFAVLKRKHAIGLVKHLDKKSQKLIRKEENTTIKKLQNIREKISSGFNSEFRNNQLKGKGKTNYFLAMIYAKSIFKSWKNWTKKRREKMTASMSITPQFSEVEYPGDNSSSSGNQEYSEQIYPKDFIDVSAMSILNNR